MILAKVKKEEEDLALKLASLSPYSRAKFDRSKVNQIAITQTPKVEERKLQFDEPAEKKRGP